MQNLANNAHVKTVLNKTEEHLERIFLAGAIIGALSCFARADYNLPMYAFLYLMWAQDDVSFRIMRTMKFIVRTTKLS